MHAHIRTQTPSQGLDFLKENATDLSSCNESDGQPAEWHNRTAREWGGKGQDAAANKREKLFGAIARALRGMQVELLKSQLAARFAMEICNGDSQCRFTM